MHFFIVLLLRHLYWEKVALIAHNYDHFKSKSKLQMADRK